MQILITIIIAAISIFTAVYKSRHPKIKHRDLKGRFAKYKTSKNTNIEYARKVRVAGVEARYFYR